MTKQLNAYKRIRRGMRENEVSLLAHLRTYHACGWSVGTSFFGRAWHNALDRLQTGGMVRYQYGRYYVPKGARPVTAAVR